MMMMMMMMIWLLLMAHDDAAKDGTASWEHQHIRRQSDLKYSMLLRKYEGQICSICRQLEAGQLSCCPNARWMLGAVSRCLGCSVHGTRVFEAFSCACFIYWHQSIANLNCLEYLRASLFCWYIMVDQYFLCWVCWGLNALKRLCSMEARLAGQWVVIPPCLYVFFAQHLGVCCPCKAWLVWSPPEILQHRGITKTPRTLHWDWWAQHWIPWCCATTQYVWWTPQR